MVTLSQKVEEILNKGADLAKEKRHAFLTPEHMLKAMLCDEEIKEFIESAGGKITEMNTELDNYFNEIPTVSEAKPSEDSEPELPDEELDDDFEDEDENEDFDEEELEDFENDDFDEEDFEEEFMKGDEE